MTEKQAGYLLCIYRIPYSHIFFFTFTLLLTPLTYLISSLSSPPSPGTPMVSAPAYDDDVGVWFYERPFSQPLSNIREYYGEKIALYYAWLGYYTYMLLIPAVLGSLMLVLFAIRGYEYTKGHIDWFLVGFVFAMVAWAAIYKQGWERECSIIALKWGKLNCLVDRGWGE